MTADLRPIPETADFDTGPFWQAAQEGRIVVSVCASCGHVIHLPRPGCDLCGAADVGWKDVAPRGTVYSWTVVEHPIHPGFPVPYTVVLVQLDDAPEARLVTCIDGRPELQAGMPMRAVFDDVRDRVVVPQWVAADD